MADDPPKELLDAVTAGRALIICGAGVSRAATNGSAPGWAQLIKDALYEAATPASPTKSSKAAKPPKPKTEAWVKACKALLKSKAVEDRLDAANTIQKKLGGLSGGPYRAFFKRKLGKTPSYQASLDASYAAASVRPPPETMRNFVAREGWRKVGRIS